MTTPPDDTTADLHAVIATLRAERDAAVAREAALGETLADRTAGLATRTAELAERKTEFDERIEHQAATMDVLKAMSASPGDPQPVFDLIATRARDLCDACGATVFEFDGTLIHWRAATGVSDEPSVREAVEGMYPMAPSREWPVGRAIMDRQIIHISDLDKEPGLNPTMRGITARPSLVIPFIRADLAIGALELGSRERGGFSDSQIELLKTFAEQAVIAITSAEAHRGLVTRTDDLHDSLRYQTAISDVLNVISRSSVDLQHVLDKLVETAARLCEAEMAMINRRDAKVTWVAANYGYPPELWAHWLAVGPSPLDPRSEAVGMRTMVEGRVVHVHDVAAVPGYPVPHIALGGLRTILGVPLRRGDEVIGNLGLARQRVKPFTERQVALLENFAAQAVIAMDNARLLAEQREALEQQTAMAEVLQIINASPGNLTPVFAAMLDRAMRLCEAAFGELYWFDHDIFNAVADQGVPVTLSEFRKRNPTSRDPRTVPGRIRAGEPSPGNLAPVFDAMLERALHLCESAFGVLATYDGEAFHHVAFRGVTPELAEFLRQRYRPGPGLAMHRVVQGEDVVQVADIVDDDAYRSGFPARRAMADLGGARTQLLVALRKDGALLGALTIYRKEVRPFSDKQIALLKNFAAQAVIAIENGRLIDEQREALEQQTATAEVLRVINESPGNLAPVFNAVLEKTIRLCDSAVGTLTTYDGNIMRCVATRGLTPEQEALLVDRPPAAGQPTGRIADGESVVHLLDARDQDGYRAGFGPTRNFVDQGGARTAMWVALRKDRELLGILTIFRREVRAFTDKEVALVQNFAAQAVIAIENARLITEQQEALEQQIATAEVLQVINASPGNLTPVFDAMLEKAMRLCGAAFGSLYTYDGEQFHSAAQRGVPAAYAAYRASNPPTLRWGGILAQMIETKRPIHTLDTMAGEDYLAVRPDARALADLGRARTNLIVPLLKEETFLGYISIYRQEVRAFSDKQIALLQNFAAQAVIAMDNARLITEQREALEQQTATAEVLQVINASPGNLPPVFDAILEKALRLCDSAFGVFSTYDEESFHIVAARGVPDVPDSFLQRPHKPVPGLALTRIVQGEDVVQIADITDDEAYRQGIPDRRFIADVCGGRTQILIALRKDKSLLGMFNIFRQEVRPFTVEQITLMENFAAQAVIAMENARLLDEIRQRQAELRTTFDNMADGVAMFDGNLRLAAWNRNFQELLDIPAAVLAECPTYAEYLRILAERGEFGTEDIEVELGRRLENADQELRLERARPNGQVIEVRRNAVPDGGFVLIYSDITERKRSEAEIRAARDAAEATLRDLKAAQANLIQAEKMASLGQLTAGIAHEIKNPLNFVNNFAALSVDLLSELKETAASGFALLTDDQRADIDDVSAMLTSNLEKITEHGKRADGIVKAMLEHSRGSSAERRTVDLNALIDEALNLAYHGARAKDQSFNITLERDFGGGITPIEVNPQEITRVFLNIFSNGFYAATRRARNGGDAGFVPMLKVTTRDAGEMVEIRVRDNGTGIPAEIRDKLFQPFFTTKPTGEGTGLGLSITYDIVTKQHGGMITVDSEVDEFTEFVVTLPHQMFTNGGSRT